MNKNLYTPLTPKLFIIIGALISILVLQSSYLYFAKGIDENIQTKKVKFLTLSGLPDLAISTETTYVRHRSMSDLFSIYRDDAALREYFPSTYTYSHSHTING